MFAYYPELRDRLDIRKIGFTRPRPEIIAMLGEENQGCPCIVLADPSKAEGLATLEYDGHVFINDHRVLYEYLAREYGVSRPAHD